MKEKLIAHLCTQLDEPQEYIEKLFEIFERDWKCEITVQRQRTTFAELEKSGEIERV